MSSTAFLYILASLVLSPLVSARGGGGHGGGHSGGGSSGSSHSTTGTSSTPAGVCIDVQVLWWCIPKIWVIIPSVILGIIVLVVVIGILNACSCFSCFGLFGWMKRKGTSKSYQKAEARRMQAAKADALRDEEWGHTWQQNYAPVHSKQDSQQTLTVPYAQGGLGYNGKDQMVYTPPTHAPAAYPVPLYHQHQHTGSQTTLTGSTIHPHH